MALNEDQLSRWAKPPSETEEGKCQHTVSRITKALRQKFANRVSIFTQGSYRNRTNVRQDSDVDLVVRLDDIYFANIDALSEFDKAQWNMMPRAPYTFGQFKSDVQFALDSEFDYRFVNRRDKCVQVLKNDQRVNADVVPCFVHRRLRTLTSIEAEGIEFISDTGQRIISFPDQHYANGVSKNDGTSKRYKSTVRILKNVRNDLLDRRTIADKEMPSFFLECLVWNVPNDNFDANSYKDIARNVIAKMWSDMGKAEVANNYAEISDLKWLFKGSPHRTYQQAKTFMEHAWSYIGF